MNITQTVKIAIGNLAGSRLRTSLAMLGILVGTASVVAMVSSGELATQQALKQFKNLGTNLMAISLFTPGGSTNVVKKMTSNEVIAVKAKVPAIEAIAPYTTIFSSVSYRGNKINSAIIGATDALKDVIKIPIKEGRFISFLDNFENYCVLGNGVYQQIKQYTVGSVIGKQIRVGKNYFTIIGVAGNWPQNNFFNQNVNQSIMIPIQTSFILSKYTQINNVILSLDKDADIDKVESEIKAYFSSLFPKERLFFQSAKELINSMKKQRQILTLLLGLIGSISLIVGGIGVMNIMLVSVIERRREIGIRRALGARRRDIQTMFLTESVMLSVFGGALGVFVGILASFIVADYANWHFTIFIFPPIIGFTVSVMIGIFFGYYPARQAARLDPIQTLRGA